MNINLEDLDDDFDLDTLLDEPSVSPTAHLPSISTTSTPLWPIGMLRDLALGIDDEATILNKYSFSPAQFDIIREHPKFKQEFSRVAQSLQASGEIFASRAATQAEDYLVTIDQLIHDPDTDRKTQLQAICKVVEWSGLAARATNARTTVNEPQSTQTNVQININL